jgi:hypothetical protein
MIWWVKVKGVGSNPKMESIISSWDYFNTTDSMSLVFSMELG